MDGNSSSSRLQLILLVLTHSYLYKYGSLSFSSCMITCNSVPLYSYIFNILRASFLIRLGAKWRWTESMEKQKWMNVVRIFYAMCCLCFGWCSFLRACVCDVFFHIFSFCIVFIQAFQRCALYIVCIMHSIYGLYFGIFLFSIVITIIFSF